MQLIRIFLILFAVLPVFCQSNPIKIVIDPGHGGIDPGRLTLKSSHFEEKDLNLIIAQKFGAYVTDLLQNVEVVYTRTSDISVSLDQRVEIANNENCDIFISIHCNANEKPGVHGTECHIHNLKAKKSFRLAHLIDKEFKNRAGRHSRGIKDSDDREHSLQVLKFTKMTSVLIECGYMTNATEAAYLNSAYGQDILASALFRGLRSYLQEEYPKINFVKPLEKESKTGDIYVQIYSSKEALSTNEGQFKKTGEDVVCEKLDTKNAYKYRYIIGPFETKSAAEKCIEKVKKKGFTDAFMIRKE